MKIVCAFLFLSLSHAVAGRPIPMQDKKAVEIESGFLSSHYRQENQLLQPGSMYEVLAAYPEAKGLAAASKGWMYPGLALGFAGGLLVGYAGVQPLVGQDFNAPLFFSGAGACVAAMLLGKVADSKLAEAVQAYNKALGGAALRWDLAPRGSALRMAWRF